MGSAKKKIQIWKKKTGSREKFFAIKNKKKNEKKAKTKAKEMCTTEKKKESGKYFSGKKIGKPY